MTLQEIINLERTVVHCPTEISAIVFLNTLHSMGYKWASGNSYLNNSKWKNYEKNTCYFIEDGTYARLSYFQNNNYKIISVFDIPELSFKKEIKRIKLIKDETDR